MSKLKLKAVLVPFLSIILVNGDAAEAERRAPAPSGTTSAHSVQQDYLASPSSRRLAAVDVRMFGARPRNDGNDTLAFQRAFAFARGSGRPIFVPGGVYRISEELDLFEGQTLFGVGNASQLVADVSNLRMLNLRGSQIDIHGLFLRGAAGAEGVTAIHVNPDGDVNTNFNSLHGLRIESVDSGIIIQAGLKDVSGADRGAWFTSLTDINVRFVVDGVQLTAQDTNLSNGANGTRAYNVRVGDCGTAWRITRADTASVFGLATEGCNTGVLIEDSAGADNNGSMFFGPRFEANSFDIVIEPQSFFNGFVGLEAGSRSIEDQGVDTLFIGSARTQFDWMTYSGVDGLLRLKSVNGVEIQNGVGIGAAPTPGLMLDVVGEARVTGVSDDGSGRLVCIKDGGAFGTCTAMPLEDAVSCSCQ